ncbi:MAG: hypothetical protein PHG05_00860 [Candidatus Nanoarchaeia archaeon]|nr:hypothetical protein [Candidatus Nanoarchaeia archaeon]
MKEKRGISKNTLAILLILIIIISSVGTIMAIKNKDNVKTFEEIEMPATGKVGIYVNQIEKEDTDDRSIK